MIEVQNLTKSFGSLLAVDDVSFAVKRGEVLGFLGPNGAGKSTTMKMVTGFIAPDAGSVTVAGKRLADDPVGVKRSIGYLPEGAPLYGDMTPRAFLEFIADVRGLSGAHRTHRIEAVIEDVSLHSVLDKPNEVLSKGFKRRVGLAQALLHDPEVLVLDEPTDGLDPNQKYEVRQLISKMAEDKAIVLSTHILEEVEAVCTRTIIIASGKVISDGTPQDLEARSRFHNAMTVSVAGVEAQPLAAALAALDGVDDVEILQADETVVLRVFPTDAQSLTTTVADCLTAQGIRAKQLQVERGRLDEVFRDLTLGHSGTRT